LLSVFELSLLLAGSGMLLCLLAEPTISMAAWGLFLDHSQCSPAALLDAPFAL